MLFVSTPTLWPGWPFLPVIRRAADREEELGVVFDALGACGLTGYRATVFHCNLFALPPTVAALLALPREVYDAPEEVVHHGWRVD
ncbi:hypothetical protein FRUB_10190 [Fimbriiglobus ruber]|uniref:Uncharacterized protein n=1 Tax=Fimbriiglobus ruber TaxID=1908690 RepID=A0A225DAR1_9BACT|nr:hypothetical protein FRUB_10190 [Fimbriiglobus ruber]